MTELELAELERTVLLAENASALALAKERHDTHEMHRLMIEARRIRSATPTPKEGDAR
jgi:hypothetical protein